MVALRNQNFPKRGDMHGARYAHKAALEIYARTFVGVTNDLFAAPAGMAGVVALIGVSTDHYKPGQMAESEKGCFCIPVPNASASKIGSPVYAVDNNTLSLDGAGGRLKFGTIEAIDQDGVWVRV